MSIEIRPSRTDRAQPGDIDEIAASGVTVHLEQLSDNDLMLIVEDDERHLHLRISHNGHSPLRIWKYESLVPKNEHNG